jgi:hypothetical protein
MESYREVRGRWKCEDSIHLEPHLLGLWDKAKKRSRMPTSMDTGGFVYLDRSYGCLLLESQLAAFPSSPKSALSKAGGASALAKCP